MAKGRISRKQKEILDYIKERILEKGYPPSVREICAAVNLRSTSSVHSHLETLEKNGYIRRDPTKPRTIEICDDSFQMVRTEMVSIPVVGRVAAGEPALRRDQQQGDAGADLHRHPLYEERQRGDVGRYAAGPEEARVCLV